MKILLIVMGVLEGLTGIALLIVPDLIAGLLLGVRLDDPGTIVLTRLTGVALVSLAIACWYSRDNGLANIVVKSMLFYNVAAPMLLVYTAPDGKLWPGLWIAILTHGGLSIWCLVSLRNRNRSDRSTRIQ